MTRLPRISGQEAVRALERLGFVRVRQRGSHVILRKDLPGGAMGCAVPLHRELAVGTSAVSSARRESRQKTFSISSEGAGG